ncbi:MAG: sulfite exporter TauE/SafE family protein [Humibacillus sp.]|nr:sulfite exporter TauE/SafE family protein [Humibacillus sp.]
MDIDWILVLATFGIGIVVGLTGMGGGALMTPVLVIFFGIPPLTAVSSDLVAAAVMKPVGSLVHLRRGTVNLALVKWLAIGSVPAAFCGVLITRAMGDGEAVQHGIQIALGVALLVAAAGLSVRAYVRLAERARRRDGSAERLPQERPEVVVRVLPTVVVGILGGVIVGMTSVGSGSLIIIALMALYPALKASQLVGTDLVQAVPLVAAAALGHVLFGDFQLSLTLSLLIGCVPGAWLGARISSRAPGGFVRRALAFVLLASALKLLGVPTVATGFVLLAVLLAAPLVWFGLRRHHGFPGFVRLGHIERGHTDDAAIRQSPTVDEDDADEPFHAASPRS